MTPELEKVMQELATICDGAYMSGEQFQGKNVYNPKCLFRAGFRAAIAHLEKQAAFDFESIRRASIELNFAKRKQDGDFSIEPEPGFKTGAIWQWNECEARIGRAEAMKNEYLSRMQDYAESVTVFADKIKSLEARLAESERVNETLVNMRQDNLTGARLERDRFRDKLTAAEARIKDLESGK